MLYVIGDLHLSMLGGKEMDIFGGAWKGYVDKITHGFSALEETDTVVLCGDTSWGMNLTQALPDFQFLEALPGHKILLKGNHDYFWETEAKQTRFFRENNLAKLSLLHNNAHLYENAALCGTRGWFYDEDAGPDGKIFRRELIRMRASLEKGRAMTEGELVMFLHYPPLYENFRCGEMLDIMREFGVKRCYYGHVHGSRRARAVEGVVEGICFKLISADHIGFRPVPVLM
ncbi:MAG: metallophosphoesterase [Oscillospiraceae bacterium]|nr:metallophosphoesterase [Oscillospiraceae bacterium]